MKKIRENIFNRKPLYKSKEDDGGTDKIKKMFRYPLYEICCYNCGSKMESTDHYCKACGAGRGGLCDYVGICGYDKRLQRYNVKSFCSKCNLEFSSIQVETDRIYCPRCGERLAPKTVSKLENY